MKQRIYKGHSLKSLKGLIVLSLLLSFQQSYAQTGNPADHIKNNKYASYDYETGQGVITLESYVEGEIKVEPKGVDLVLVLDVSNSMCPYNNGLTGPNKNESLGKRVYLFGGDQIEYLHTGTEATNDTYNNEAKTNHDWKTTITIDGLTRLRYTIKLSGDDNLYNLAYFVKDTKYGGTSWQGDTGWYYSTSTTLTQSGTGSSARWKPYTANSAADQIYSDVKLDVLEKACRGLINALYDSKLYGSPVIHRVSVITWATKNTQFVNTALLETTSANYVTLINSVSFLTTGAKTWPCEEGLNRAAQKWEGASSDRERVVLFFTDGEPNEMYYNIVNSAKTLKIDKGAKVYSIALVADETAFANRWNNDNRISIKTYLEYVSSLYPEATGKLSSSKSDIKPGTKNSDGKQYYFWSKDGENLAETFLNIGLSYSGGANVTDMDAVDNVSLKDKINNNFIELASVLADSIKTYTAACIGKDNGGVLTFDDPVQVDSLSITVSSSETPQSVTVDGFDYSYNWCGYNAKTREFQGQKLLVEIPFKIKAPGTEDPVLTISTNASGSSLYKDTTEIEGADFTSPEIPFTEITIQKYGLKAGESGLFIVYKGGVEITRIILTGTDDDGTMVSTRLRLLDPGAVYSVTETTWAYTYTLTSGDVTDNIFPFYSTKNDGMDNTSESHKVNDFK